MRRIMSQLWSAQAINLSRKTRFLYTHNKHWKKKVNKIFITSLGSNRGQRLQLKQNIEFSSLCILTERSDDLYDNHIFAFKPLLDISRFLFKPLFYMLFFCFCFCFTKPRLYRVAIICSELGWLWCSHSFHWTFLLVFFLSIRPLILCL